MSSPHDPATFQCIPDAFAAQVAKNPDAVAIIYGAEFLTYRELDARSTQLARCLQRRGVTGESVVGLRAEGIELIVAMLGILKAGGAYLPLDPLIPRERLEWILQESGVVMVLWQQMPGDSDALPADGEFWFFQSLWPEIASESDAPLPSKGSLDGLAYVIYTSGTTGYPKGVAIPHAGVLGLVLGANYITLEATDRVAQASNVAFDAATFEIWGALLNGARLVGIDRESVLSPATLEQELCQHGVTVLFLTTAIFNLVACQRPGAFRSLRVVLFGGEACSPRAVAEVLRHDPPQRLLHVYGPTEDTTFALFHEVSRVEEGARTIPIGQPVSGTEVLLLDACLRPVAVGEAGEIYLGGPRLARGYLHREDLTLKQFVPHPFQPGARLYRTGDLARALPDGNVEFIGRTDHQVKLRGFRIELDGVEATLSTHPGVAQQTVLLLGETNEDKRLVAYLTATGRDRPTNTELRIFLKERLPDYMIPSAFVWVDRLPITPNGKMDTRALKMMDTAEERPEDAFVPPQTPTEHALAAIWAKLLHQTRVGRDDNFFDVGGHSLMAARMFTEIRKDFGKSLPLGTLFQRPTLRALAEMIDGAECITSLMEIQSEGDKLPLFLVHGGGGGVFIFQALATHLGRERPIYGLEAPWLGSSPDRYWTMEELAAFYLREIRRVQPNGPYHLGGFSLGGSIAFEMGQQLHHQGEEVASLLLLDAFNYQGASLLGWSERWSKRIVRGWRRVAGSGFFQKVRLMARRTWVIIKEYLLVYLAPTPTAGKPVTTPLQHTAFALKQIDILLRYRPQIYTGPITLILCEQQSEGVNFVHDPNYGWQGVALGGLHVIQTSGVHETMFEEPHVQKLARWIALSLDGKS